MIHFLFFISLFIITILAGALKYVWDQLKGRKAYEADLVASWEQLQARYKDVIDLEAYKENLSTDLNAFKEKLSHQIDHLQKEAEDKRAENATLSNQADEIKTRLELYNGEQTVIDCGLYTPVYDFDISQKYKDALEEVREQQKDSLKAERAARCTGTWTVNGDIKAGQKQTKDYTKLMLRAFNGEADAIVSNVRWNNVDRMIERLEGVYQAVNKLGETHAIKIERDYFQLKLKELRLTYEYQEKLKAEKDEQHRIQEQIREEERAQKGIEKRIKDSEEEENRSRMALEQARQQLQLAQSAEATAGMTKKIQVLEAQLAEALAKKEEAKEWAKSKAGNVYIVSNIGSLGDNRFKIGMTRRPDPYERVHELGNASVPFEFDVHAMIRSENALQLEADLHERLRSRSVNLVNPHKEFFDINIEELETIVKEFNATIEIVKSVEAKSYRQTMAIRAQKSSSASNGQQLNRTSEWSTSQAKEYQVYIINNGAQEGPYSFEKINELLAGGKINPATPLWYEGLTEWIPISQLQGQTNALSSTALPTPQH